MLNWEKVPVEKGEEQRSEKCLNRDEDDGLVLLVGTKKFKTERPHAKTQRCKEC